MVVWLASYPRSGNTFFRILLKQLYGINTPTAYIGADHTAFEGGKELVGHVAAEWTVDEMVLKQETLIVKTHRRASDNFPAIYLHRDGRDSIVSYAQKMSNSKTYHDTLKRLITTSGSSTGTWGQNVLHWLKRAGSNTICVSYEELIENPESVVENTLRDLKIDRELQHNYQSIPRFEDLREVNSQFFRRGVVGSYKDEMPDELHEIFWEQPEHHEAMNLLGYSR